MADIFKEVDEDLRRERYLKLWRKYGKYVIAGAVAIVVATAASVAWQEYRKSQMLEQSTRFAQALDLAQEGRTAEAAAAFANLAADASADFTALARLQEAALKAKSGDVAGAVQIYGRLANDNGVDRAFRDLAVILGALHTVDSADPAALVERLAPLTAENSPWRHSALELTALAVERLGDRTRAGEIFARLAGDPDAPLALRMRAAEMLAAFGE